VHSNIFPTDCKVLNFFFIVDILWLHSVDAAFDVGTKSQIHVSLLVKMQLTNSGHRGRCCWLHFGMHNVFFSLSSWITEQHYSTWGMPSGWNTVVCSQCKWSFPMTARASVQPVMMDLLEQFCCRCLSQLPCN
jgi:hypothetical protein